MLDLFDRTLTNIATATKRFVLGTPGTVESEAENITHEDLRYQIGNEIVPNAPDKTTPVDADELGLWDSEDSFDLKAISWANLKIALGISNPVYDFGFALSDEESDLTTDNESQDEIIRAQTLESITFFVNTAPAGSSIICEVYKNAGLIETITLTAGSTTVTVANTEALIVGDRVRATITQVGSTTAGAGAKINFKSNLT